MRIDALSVLAAAAVALGSPAVTEQVGPTRLLSPSFGYTVAYRTVDRNQRVTSTLAVFIYDHGRWRNATPPHMRADAIDDIAFLDSRHAWLAAFDCATVGVYLYRTSDGGMTWQALGGKADHSCGGGPTWLSFVDREHGWMEPVSPNGPAGTLLRTSDGGRSWTSVATLERNLPCLAPIAFLSRTTGWMGRCDGHVYLTIDGGARWLPAAIPVPRAPRVRQFDVPRFFGRTGIEATMLGDSLAHRTSLSERAVAFSVSTDGGRSWALRSVRPVTPCTLSNGVDFFNSWQAGIASAQLWWVVTSGRRPLVQITDDAGRHWHTVVPHGLPNRPCAVMRVTAASGRMAWVVARSGVYDSALYQTQDGGRTWNRVHLLG